MYLRDVYLLITILCFHWCFLDLLSLSFLLLLLNGCVLYNILLYEYFLYDLVLLLHFLNYLLDLDCLLDHCFLANHLLRSFL